MGKPVLAGLDRLARGFLEPAAWGRCALLCNQASLTCDFRHSVDVLRQLPQLRLSCLLAPQHGLFGTAQDNMIETPHSREPGSYLPVYSLYSETRIPELQMLEGCDTLVIDLQISGCRIYTFKSTILACLKVAKEAGKKVVVLDRPNPLGGEVLEGRVADPQVNSFVNPGPIPLRHGLSPAEFALFVNRTIGCNLEVVPMENWDPAGVWTATGRPWILTSPNLPSGDSIFLYPGMVLFEGTNVSEGRGTGLPFQLVGSPFLSDPRELIAFVRDAISEPPGIMLRPASFEPTSGKWRGKECRGLQLHVIDPIAVRSFSLAIALIQGFQELCGGGFSFKEPPYEYEYQRPPVDMILACDGSAEKLLRWGGSHPFWKPDAAAWYDEVRDCLLYPRHMKSD